LQHLLPPHSTPTEKDLVNLIHQLPIPFLFTGDFNAHHPIWENPKQCPKGTLIENIIINNDISLLKTNNPATGSMSSIDLALCSPAIALNYHWQPKNDTFGKDHFPIIISSTKTSSPSPHFQQYLKIKPIGQMSHRSAKTLSLSLS